MELINYRLILMVVSFLFTGVTRDCVDESSSIGFINPVVKPFGIFGEIATGSMSPLINAIKKSPSWFEKGEINTNKKNNKKTNQVETEEEAVEETALVENTTKSDEEVKGQETAPKEEEEEEEEVLDIEVEEPAAEEPANPIPAPPKAEEPKKVVVSSKEKQEYKKEYEEAIRNLEKEVNALKTDNLTNRFRKPTRDALAKIEALNVSQTNKKATASIKKIKGHLNAMDPNGEDNASFKNQMIEEVKNLKEEADKIQIS